MIRIINNHLTNKMGKAARRGLKSNVPLCITFLQMRVVFDFAWNNIKSIKFRQTNLFLFCTQLSRTGLL